MELKRDSKNRPKYTQKFITNKGDISVEQKCIIQQMIFA